MFCLMTPRLTTLALMLHCGWPATASHARRLDAFTVARGALAATARPRGMHPASHLCDGFGRCRPLNLQAPPFPLLELARIVAEAGWLVNGDRDHATAHLTAQISK